MRNFALTTCVTKRNSSAQTRKLYQKYSELIASCLATNNELKALDWFLEMKGAMKLEIFMYTNVIKSFLAKNQLDCTARIFQELMQEKFKPEEFTIPVNVIIDGCCRNGHLQLAEELFHEVLEMKIPPSVHSFSILIKQNLKEANGDRVCELVEQMVQHDVEHDHPLYNMIIHYFAKMGLFERAKSMLAVMHAVKLKPSIVTYSGLLRGMIEHSSDNMSATTRDSLAHFIEEVLAVVPEMDDKLLDHVLVGLFKCNLGARAEQVFFERIGKISQPSIYLFTTMIHGLVDHPDKVSTILQLMSNSNTKPNIATLTALLPVFVSQGQGDKIIELHGIAKKLYQGDLTFYKKLILSLLSVQQVDKAQEVYYEMIAAKICPTTSIVTDLSRILIAYGDLEGARQVCAAASQLSHTLGTSLSHNNRMFIEEVENLKLNMS